MWARIGIDKRVLAAALGTFARTPGVVTDDLLGFHGGKISVKLFCELEEFFRNLSARVASLCATR